MIEFKAGRFRHEYAGQLGFYVSIVDDQMRNPALHAPTVGILLGTGSTANTVKYALRAANAPMAVPHTPTTPCHQPRRPPSPGGRHTRVHWCLDADNRG